MKVKGIKCPYCKEIIYSRARHDFKRCSCGKIFIDGGRDYIRYGSTKDIINDIEIYEIELDVTEINLINDWNNYKKKYGCIKPYKQKLMKDKIKRIKE